MVKQLQMKMLFLFGLLFAGAGSVWADNPVTVTLTQSALGLTGSYTTNTQKTLGGIT